MDTATILSIAESLLDAVIKLLGPEQAKAALDKLVVRTANDAADLAEDLKFGLTQ